MTTADEVSGGGMQALRQTLKPRRQRKAPEPRHPKKPQPTGEETNEQPPLDDVTPSVTSSAEPDPAETKPDKTEPQADSSLASESADSGQDPEPRPEPESEPEPGPQPDPEPAIPAGSSPKSAPRQKPGAKPKQQAEPGEAELPTPKVAWTMPEAETDPDDSTALYVSPTVAKIPVPVMRRFNVARRTAVSHTAPVLDAMFGHAHELDRLILKNRPEIAARYAHRRMPLRRLTVEKSTKADLRIRPTEAELNYLKELVASINVWLESNWPKTKPTDQSEVITVLLDAFLPGAKSSKEPTVQ